MTLLVCGAAAWASATAQTTVPSGQQVDKFGAVDLGVLSMEGGTIIFRDGFFGPSTATNAVLANGWIAAAGYSARVEFRGDTAVPGASYGVSFPTDGMYIAASDAEDLFPLDAINKGQFFQTGNGQLTLGGGARFVNDVFSTYWIQNDLGMVRTSDLARSSFVNRSGSVIKASGTGTSVFALPVQHDGGKFETWSGTLHLAAGGYHDTATFYADGLGGNPSTYGISFAGSHVFTGITTTETGGLLLNQRSRIALVRGGNFDVAEWRQHAVFLVDGFQSRIEIGPDATLHNTGTLVTAGGGALVAMGAGSSPLASPGRGQLINEGFFTGVLLGSRESGPCSNDRFGDTCVINVRNARGGEMTFLPVPEDDPLFPDNASDYNAVGVFENAGRVRVPGIVEPLNGIATVVDADAFIQDRQGVATLFNTPELVIDPDGELRVGSFSQLEGDTVVNGRLTGDQIEFLGGTLSGTGRIGYGSGGFNSAIATGAVTVGPGNSPGILTIDGNLDANGTIFDIEIGGRLAGIEYDQLVVLGQANLVDSVVNLRFIDGFVPDQGDVFEWLVADPPFSGPAPLTVHVFSDLAVIEGETDGRRFYVNAVTAVPLPPAAWLYGAGLLMVGCLARRRR
ncbi:MAG: hypothetical protein Q8Q80_00790 [Methyloversatilis sp.]|uniref:hypothetical protein n=1 Tax=Methyloversatilis sp. TaxID=2569862 RepID=UPI0027332A34|nr:hypothetical protein [Methyloversatilis sp.]MDP3871172.1 hypothetical protein [Methyloversatilis sp.]